ncbi:HYR domain-containing protein, partial [Mangrovimonas sp. ST2L15]|uniref:HYR-like domain-containing protein n=1 Tax=Mangrovimonas sp. ST2L15 TaxID=1645916 RepID=UPI000B2D662F
MRKPYLIVLTVLLSAISFAAIPKHTSSQLYYPLFTDSVCTYEEYLEITSQITINDLGSSLSITDCPPANITVNVDPGQCSAVVSYTNPTTDIVDGSMVQIDLTGYTTGDAFPVGITFQTWEERDSADSPTGLTCSFNIIVEDNTPPVLVGVPADVTVECDAIPAPAVVTATDNCDTTLTVSYSETTNTVNDGVGTIVREWSVTDNDGNTTTQTQTITVEDNTPPVLVGVPADVTVECDA